MKCKPFKEEQIIRLLQEAESGLAVADVCRKHNCSEQSFYRWKQTTNAVASPAPSKPPTVDATASSQTRDLGACQTEKRKNAGKSTTI